MFPEGGNYGDAEAAYTVNALNALTNTMAQEQSNIIKTLAKHSYEPIIEIKKLFGRMMTPYIHSYYNVGVCMIGSDVLCFFV